MRSWFKRVWRCWLTASAMVTFAEAQMRELDFQEGWVKDTPWNRFWHQRPSFMACFMRFYLANGPKGGDS